MKIMFISFWILTVILIALKLSGAINWSWWIISLPAWLPYAGWMIYAVILILCKPETLD